MPMFIIQVRAIATCCYDVAVEATDEKAAISIACTPSSYRHYSPADFQVDPDICEFDPIETEQVTATCPECGREHLYPSRTIIRCDGIYILYSLDIFAGLIYHCVYGGSSHATSAS